MVLEFVAALFGSIVNPIAQTIIVPITTNAGYLISCSQNVTKMRIKKNDLDFIRLGVEGHVNHNTERLLEVSKQVRHWLEEVGNINAKVESIPDDVGGCFNLKLRHKLGRKAFKITEEIELAIERHSTIILTAHPIPPGKVHSMKASTSSPPNDYHNDFSSREQTYKKALKALEPNNKPHMIALCGMGGVGKTTMMQRLKNAVKEKHMFNYIVEAAIGEKTDPIAIQKTVANYLNIDLPEASSKQPSADRLYEWFKANSDGGKTKILIILDDVWELVNLNDIGLSALPNQGVSFKVLITSRDRHVCTNMGVEANSIFNVEVLTTTEAQSLFHEFVEQSDMDPFFHEIGDSIASRCHGLPMAIKTIAFTLKGRSKRKWNSTLTRLKKHIIPKDVVNEIFQISYDNLQNDETRSIFLLCALFPEDMDIPNEELVRYGWGLTLFT